MTDHLAILIIALLAILLLIGIWQAVTLGRIAQLLSHQPRQKNRQPTTGHTPLEAAEPATPTAPETDFDRFLAEDPQRLHLDKKEQAATYRAWRKQNGLTWNASK